MGKAGFIPSTVLQGLYRARIGKKKARIGCLEGSLQRGLYGIRGMLSFWREGGLGLRSLNNERRVLVLGLGFRG